MNLNLGPGCAECSRGQFPSIALLFSASATNLSECAIRARITRAAFSISARQGVQAISGASRPGYPKIHIRFLFFWAFASLEPLCGLAPYSRRLRSLAAAKAGCRARTWATGSPPTGSFRKDEVWNGTRIYSGWGSDAVHHGLPDPRTLAARTLLNRRKSSPMNQSARTIGKWLGQVRKSLNPRSDLLKTGKPPHASDIILGMTLAMLVVVLFAWLLSHVFGLG